MAVECSERDTWQNGTHLPFSYADTGKGKLGPFDDGSNSGAEQPASHCGCVVGQVHVLSYSWTLEG